MIGLNIGRMGRVGGSLVSPIAALFAAGEQGAWFDPSDMATLFQDSAGTTPVSAVGQPVGLMLDKSGRGNSARQVTAINRPVLQQDGAGKFYLSFNGSSQWMSTSSINFTTTDKVTLVAGVRQASASLGFVVELSTSTAANNGCFFLAGSYIANGDTSAGLQVSSGGVYVINNNTTLTVPRTWVASAAFDGSQSVDALTTALKYNGAAASGATFGTTNTGNFGNYPIYIGARAGSSLFFSGQIYSLLIRGALSSAGQISAAEAYAAGKTGITL